MSSERKDGLSREKANLVRESAGDSACRSVTRGKRLFICTSYVWIFVVYCIDISRFSRSAFSLFCSLDSSRVRLQSSFLAHRSHVRNTREKCVFLRVESGFVRTDIFFESFCVDRKKRR